MRAKFSTPGFPTPPPWWVAKANTLAELRGWTRFVGLQIEYSLLERTVERELLPLAADQDLTVLAWGPLRSGVLTGKYLPENTKQSEAEGARMHSAMMKAFRESEADAAEATVRAVLALAQELGVSPSQVSLAWLRSRPVPTIPIIGARKLAQVEDNLASVSLTLSADQLAHLDQASAIILGFPHDFIQSPPVRALVHGGLRDRIKA